MNKEAIRSKMGAAHRFPYRWTIADALFTKDKGKVFSCFACGGGSSFGYKLAGFDVIGCNEIDPMMMAAYRANHNPKYSYLEPIQTFKNRQDLPQELFELDILDGSPPCFLAGTLVMTDKGFLPIEKVVKGSVVLTHLNRFRRVSSVMRKKVNQVHSLKIQGVLPIKVTGEHPFYVRTMNRSGKYGIRVFSQPYWKEVKDLDIKRNNSNAIKSQDYIGIAINKNESLPIWGGADVNGVTKRTINFERTEFWYIIGRWMGDGWCRVINNKQAVRYNLRYRDVQTPCMNCGSPSRKHARHKNQWTSFCGDKCRKSYGRKNRKPNRNDFIVCCGKHEIDYLKKRFDELGMPFHVSEQRTTYRIVISSKELCAYVSQFGKSAKKKALTNDVLDLPVNLMEEFLNGYLEADGHYDSRRDKWSLSSISIELAHGIQHCIHKVFHTPTTISIKDNPKYANKIEGRVVNTSMSYTIAFNKSNKKQRHSFYEDGYIWVPYRNKHVINGDAEVFNMSVEEDESYTVFNLICHNCSSFSTAGNREKDWGKKKKFREGQAEQVLDTLFFDLIDLAERLQPKIVIAENVKGILLGKAIDYVKSIYEAFDRAGYECQHFLLDASVMGVPQRRERVFFIAMRKDLAKPFMEQVDMFTYRPRLNMDFNETEIPFSEIEMKDVERVGLSESIKRRWEMADHYGRYDERARGGIKFGFFYKLMRWRVCATIMSGGAYTIETSPHYATDEELALCGTFPTDYNYLDNKAQYIIGMSVPPVMVAQIVTRIYEQWLK